MPGQESSAKTALTSKHPCERQEPPNLQAGLGNAPEQRPLSASALTSLDPKEAQALEREADRIEALEDVDEMRASGDREGAAQVIEEAREALAQLGLSTEGVPEAEDDQ
jgi:hypothetical protein